MGYTDVGRLTRFLKPLQARIVVEAYVRRPRLARLASAALSVTADPLLTLVSRERRARLPPDLSIERPATFDGDRFANVFESIRRQHGITGERDARLLNWKYGLGGAGAEARNFSILAAVGPNGDVAGYVVSGSRTACGTCSTSAVFRRSGWSTPSYRSSRAMPAASAASRSPFSISARATSSPGACARSASSPRAEAKRLWVYRERQPLARSRSVRAGQLVLPHRGRRLLGGHRRLGLASYTAHSWLGLLPAGARRFRVDDPRLAAALGSRRRAGAGCAGRGGRRGAHAAWRRRGCGPSLGRPGWMRGSAPARAAKRSLASARVRIAALRAERAVRRLGYRETEVVAWDLAHRLRGARPTLRLAPVAFAGPAPAAVRDGPRNATLARAILVEAAISDAGAAAGAPLGPSGVRAWRHRADFHEAALLRVAVGPANAGDSQVAALAALAAAGAPAAVVRLLPRLRPRARRASRWTLESLLPGAAPEPPLGETLLAQCLDFLVALHAVGAGAADERPTAAGAAGIVAAVCAPAEAGRSAGPARGSTACSPMPCARIRARGLLQRQPPGRGREAPRRRRLGLGARPPAAPRPHPPAPHIGASAVGHGLGTRARAGAAPLGIEAGGDRLTRDYCHRLGIEVDPPVLEGLTQCLPARPRHLSAAHLRRAAARPRLAGGERRGRDSGAAATPLILPRWSPMRLRSGYSVA